MGIKKKKKKKKVSGRPTVIGGDSSTANDGQNGNRVFVSVGKTINIGNYESVRVEYGEGETIQDGETFSDVRKRVFERVIDGIHEMIPFVENALR